MTVDSILKSFDKLNTRLEYYREIKKIRRNLKERIKKSINIPAHPVFDVTLKIKQKN